VQKHTGAFTLIELSIVLVIIGLIVSGILFGKELIRAAEVQRQVKQIQEYQLAFHAFQNKYNCLPGDCSKATDFFGSSAPSGLVENGNGNDVIDTQMGYSFDPDTANTWSLSIELNGAFQQLALANLVGFQPSSKTSIVVGQGLPPLILNNQSSFFIGASYNFDTAAVGASGNRFNSYKRGNNAMWMLACNINNNSMGYWNDICGVFVPIDLFAIDTKLDDGKALSGKLMGAGGDPFPSGANTACLVSSDYDKTKTTRECIAVYVIN
jgi:prepilin-type N-terminal cleavage/methylation domain-containing protein